MGTGRISVERKARRSPGKEDEIIAKVNGRDCRRYKSGEKSRRYVERARAHFASRACARARIFDVHLLSVFAKHNERSGLDDDTSFL